MENIDDYTFVLGLLWGVSFIVLIAAPSVMTCIMMVLFMLEYLFVALINAIGTIVGWIKG